MIDLRAARDDPDGFRLALARKGAAEVFDELLAADQAVREIQPRVEELRAARKVKGKPTPEQMEELKRIKEELQSLEQQLAAAEARRDGAAQPGAEPAATRRRPTAPRMKTRSRFGRWGESAVVRLPRRDHSSSPPPGSTSSAPRRSRARASGITLGDIALLELALYRFALDRLGAAGFTPVIPPVLVREEAMYGTGLLPDGAGQHLRGRA